MHASDFSARLASGDPLILDGATGTELTRRGVDTRLPLWSAGALIDAPEVVRAIHADYLRAGAQVITTNTFRTHRRSLAKGGLAGRACHLTQLAVRLAREAILQTGRRAFIAGSIAPLEDCYSPQLAPPDDDLCVEHAEMAQCLAGAGVDVMLVETMNTIREARIAAQAARATGLPVIVSFVCATGTRGPAQLLSGESLAEAARAVAAQEPAAVMVNCAPVAHIDDLLGDLRQATHRPIGGYGNVGHVDDEVGWTLTDSVTPGQYAGAALVWRDQGASIIGGCCGTTPEHIAELTRALQRQQAQPR